MAGELMSVPNEEPTKDQIRAIVTADSRYYYRTIRRDFRSFYDRMNSGYFPLAENIYCWLNYDGRRPVCASCGSTKLGFEGPLTGFRKYCSGKCSANSTAVRQKYTATSLERFGVPNPRQASEPQAVFKKTMLQRHGVLHALQKREFLSKAVESNKKVDIKQVIAKRTATNLGRFGVPVASQNTSVKAKRAATSLQRCGFDTPLRDPARIAVTKAKKRQQFMDKLTVATGRVTVATPLFIEFNGVNGSDTKPIYYPWNCITCGRTFQGHLDCGFEPICPFCNDAPSTGEKELRDFITSLGVAFTTNDRKIACPQEIDILIEDRKLGIEFNGQWWHCDHKVHRLYHANKHAACQAKGYRLIQIFEGEWIRKRPIVQSRIRAMLGLNKTIYARQCIITKITSKDKRRFMETNHLQGDCQSSINFGLHDRDGRLVAAMTFGKTRFDKTCDFEMLRFANCLDTTVVGGASRLFKQFQQINPTASVVSYSDRRWNAGKLYTQLGFRFHHTSTPNYYYSLDRVELLSRQYFQKHKLVNILENFDHMMSESENMYAHGYIRLWDCGNDVFVWKPT